MIVLYLLSIQIKRISKTIRPGTGETCLSVRGPILTPKIPLGVDDQPLSPRKRLLKQGIPGRQRNTIVATFNN
jgi:hypothetical protein